MRYLAWAALPLILASLLQIAAVSSAWADQQETRVTDPKVLEELKVIARHHDAAKEKIKSMVVSATIQREEEYDPSLYPFDTGIPAGKLVSTYDGKWMREGDKYRIDMHRISYAPDKDFKLDETNVVALNDEYFAQYIGDLLIVQPHRSMDLMLANVAGRAKIWWRLDPTMFGFTIGSSIKGLLSQLELEPGFLIWTLQTEQDEDGSLYVLEYTCPSKHVTVDTRRRIVIDPDKGFLVTRLQHWDGNGELLVSYEVELQQLPNGLWFPKSGHRKQSNYVDSLIVHSVSVNEDIDDNAFRTETFPVDPAKTKMKLYSENGMSATMMVLYQGQWVPENPAR